MTAGPKNFVTALARGISILEAFDELHPELGITQLSERAGLAKTTTFRLVQTLTSLRYLVSTPGGKYRLGPRILSLGYAVLQTMDLKCTAEPYLKALSDACGETVNMAVLDGDELVYIERFKTQQIVNINLHVGSRLPLYNTAMGRALLSGQTKEWTRAYIDRHMKYPETSPFLGPHGEHLLTALRIVNEKGYAVNDQELAKGLRSIAAPVRDSKGNAVAAINIAVPSARVTLHMLKTRYGPLVLKTAHSISEALGFHRYRSIR